MDLPPELYRNQFVAYLDLATCFPSIFPFLWLAFFFRQRYETFDLNRIKDLEEREEEGQLKKKVAAIKQPK